MKQYDWRNETFVMSQKMNRWMIKPRAIWYEAECKIVPEFLQNPNQRFWKIKFHCLGWSTKWQLTPAGLHKTNEPFDKTEALVRCLKNCVNEHFTFLGESRIHVGFLQCRLCSLRLVVWLTGTWFSFEMLVFAFHFLSMHSLVSWNG